MDVIVTAVVAFTKAIVTAGAVYAAFVVSLKAQELIAAASAFAVRCAACGETWDGQMALRRLGLVAS